MKRPLILSFFLVAFVASSASAAATWYVDASVPASGDGLSWETAFKTIKEGTGSAATGDTVLVGEGVYSETVWFEGKDIIVRSRNPFDHEVVANTIIHGEHLIRAVTFYGTEGGGCALSGFTVRNGHSSTGAGVYGRGTGATIQNNVITGNSADQRGGAVYQCHGLIQNNLIVGNSAGTGGGSCDCDGIIRNNTVLNNKGGNLYDCDGEIVNCIIWGNWGGLELLYSSVPTYSCIRPWRDGGEGNISEYPHFVDTENGDYHLRSYSPCIDAGDPNSAFSEEPEPNGGRINMGAHGNTPGATSKSPDTDDDGLPDDWEMVVFGNLAQGASDDPDEDGIRNLREYHRGLDPMVPMVPAALWHVDASASTSGDGTSWETAFKDIQEGIDAASHGDTVIVAEGIYYEDVHLKGKNIVLRSTDPLDPAVVAGTILAGCNPGAAVIFSGVENCTCVLSGFTIRGCLRGILGTTFTYHTHATIENNIIVANRTVLGECGAGLSRCNGIIRNNIIAANSAEWMGGGLAYCNGMIYNNLIVGNCATGWDSIDGWVDGRGGALYSCHGTIQNNIIANNWAMGREGSGGGMDSCTGTIRNCIIWGNTAKEGAQLHDSSTPTYSCIQDWAGGGQGNISSNPEFADPGGPDNDPKTTEDNNYRLSPDSPCIDAGDNSALDPPGLDLDGNLRIAFGKNSLTIDMGAYEYNSLPFAVTDVVVQNGVVQLMWNSQPSDTYTVWSSTNLAGIQWDEKTSLPSQGFWSTWRHSGLTAGRTFYRIEMKQ